MGLGFGPAHRSRVTAPRPEETKVKLCRARKKSATLELSRPSGLFSPDFCLYNLSLLSVCFFLSCFYFASQGHDDAVPCAVLKNVDSFSFLHHPVHQRSLEILQRCKEEKYSKAPPPASPSQTTLTRREMETRCIVRHRKGEKKKPRMPKGPFGIKPVAVQPLGKLLGGVPRVKLNANPHFLRYGVILLAVSLFTRRCDAGNIFGVCFLVVITRVIISSKHRRSGRNIPDRRHAADAAGIWL